MMKIEDFFHGNYDPNNYNYNMVLKKNTLNTLSGSSNNALGSNVLSSGSKLKPMGVGLNTSSFGALGSGSSKAPEAPKKHDEGGVEKLLTQLVDDNQKFHRELLAALATATSTGAITTLTEKIVEAALFIGEKIGEKKHVHANYDIGENVIVVCKDDSVRKELEESGKVTKAFSSIEDLIHDMSKISIDDEHVKNIDILENALEQYD